jgi:hypothetical protein
MRDTLWIGHSRVENEGLLSHDDVVAAERGEVAGYGLDGGVVARTPRRLVLAHQIEWVKDCLLVVDTGRERLSAYTADGAPIREVALGEHEWDHGPGGRLGHHFNSVHRSGERVWIVAHNHELPSEVWELSWPALELVRVHATAAEWAHNVWDGELGLVVCDSGRGSLHEVRSGETLWGCGEDRMVTRGLAVGEKHLFVGRSGFADRGERLVNDGGLWVVDRATLTTVEQFRFPGSGCVNEVRLLDGPDECHNGEPFDERLLAGLSGDSQTARVSAAAERRGDSQTARVLTTEGMAACAGPCKTRAALNAGLGVKDRVAKDEEVQRDEHRDGCEVDKLHRQPESRRQNRGRDRGERVLGAGEQQIAGGLAMQRQRVLLVMGPHEQPLQREVNRDAGAGADGERDLKAQSDHVGQQRRAAEIDDGDGAAGEGVAHALREQAGAAQALVPPRQRAGSGGVRRSRGAGHALNVDERG